MVTDSNTNYTSPAGREFTFAAARFAGINPSSLVLDMGCGFGDGPCNLAEEFRCRIIACDSNNESIDQAQHMAIERHVSHLISFEHRDISSADYNETSFDLILAEGGVLSCIGRNRGLQLAASWLQPRGWFSFSDLVVIATSIPKEIRSIFDDDHYHYETEHSYRDLLKTAGFDVHFISLVPPSGWDNYYAHMARRLEDKNGMFADRKIKLAFHREIDAFYRIEAYKYIGYLFGIARKNSP